MTDLTQLKKDRDNARETYLTQSRKRQKLEKKRPSAYDKYIGSKPESPQRVKLKKEYYDLLDDIADARKEENRLYGVFESLDNKVKGYKSKPSNQNVPNQHGQSNSPRLDNLNSGWSNKSDKTVREITTAPSGILPGLNFPNKRRPVPAMPKDIPSNPVEVAASQLMYPSMAPGANELPPLVRRDGRPPKPAEAMYPAMAYKVNVHEPWPEEAIQLATKKYPALPQQIAVSQELVPDHPDDLNDPDYFELPDNPTLKDMYRHAAWKEKKQGGL